jgi:hypothetical protein
LGVIEIQQSLPQKVTVFGQSFSLPPTHATALGAGCCETSLARTMVCGMGCADAPETADGRSPGVAPTPAPASGEGGGGCVCALGCALGVVTSGGLPHPATSNNAIRLLCTAQG